MLWHDLPMNAVLNVSYHAMIIQSVMEEKYFTMTVFAAAAVIRTPFS